MMLAILEAHTARCTCETFDLASFWLLMCSFIADKSVHVSHVSAKYYSEFALGLLH